RGAVVPQPTRRRPARSHGSPPHRPQRTRAGRRRAGPARKPGRGAPAATAPLTPGPVPGPGAWESADDTPWHDPCRHPVPLRGRIDAVDLATGELRPMYDTGTEPGGVLLAPCGNRRESVCPACSQVYKRDARHLVRAGLTGGKGVPDSIAAHPCVFATFTAPSFGPVHARRKRGKTVLPCRPRRDAKSRRCPHGRDISCPIRHAEHDPRL